MIPKKDDNMDNLIPAVKAIANNIDVYGVTLEAIKEGRIHAENSEELSRLMNLVSNMQRKIDEIRNQFAQDLLDGKTEEARVRFHIQLQHLGREFLRAIKALKIQMTPSPSQEISEFVRLLELIQSSTKDPVERAQAQRIKEVLSELAKEGLV